MKKIIKSLCLLTALFSITSSNAQMSGSYAVPGTITSLAAAINSLNTLGISGPVSIDIAVGYTEIAPVGGYTLNTIVGASAVNTIIFQKSGVGVNPIITAYATGTAIPTSAVQDGIWSFVGTDYVTIDGIDLNDANIANPATMEYGYGFFKASATDGCQNNTIKNCRITLKTINNAAGTVLAVDGSRGIEVVNASIATHTTVVTVTSAAGANSNNKFYSNTIENCNIGIAMIGFADTTPFAFADTGNDIGGASALTGNTIINFGGGGAIASAGIRTLAQYGINVSYNLLNNNNGAGVTHADVLRGIFINTAASANSTINSNTVTLQSAGTTQLMSAIQNVSGSTAAANTINILNNVITNCTYTSAATSAVFNGILNSGTASTVNINGNTISNVQLKTTGVAVLIELGSPVNAFCNTNTVTGISNAGASGTTRLIKMTSPDNTVINNNLIDGVSYSNITSTGSIDGIFSTSSPINITVNGNILRNFSVPLSGIINGIRENGIAGNKIVQNNAIYNFSTTAGGAGGASYNGIFLSPGTMTISGNSIYSLNNTGTTGGGGTINGIQISAGNSATLFKNKIYDISSTSTVAVISGIFINGAPSNRIYNNLIGGLTAPASAGANAVMGINLASGTANFVYFNTINLSGTSTSTLFGTSAVFANTGSTLDMRNNILSNTSVPTGTGTTVAYRRSSATLASYSVSSNGNLFYAGTPGTSNLIFTDGTAIVQTLAAYKTLMVTRDVSSITENPTFVSILGSNANFLNINTVTPTQIESGASPVAGITDDYAATVRNVATPDIGAWEGTFVLMDLTMPNFLGSGFTSQPCNLATRSFTAALSDASGIGSALLSPRLYYKVNAGAYASVSGTLTSGTAISGVWTFDMAYTAVATDVVSYYLVAQDAAATPNLFASPSAGFAGSDVNTITTPPTTPNTYTVTSTLNGIYTVGAAGTFTSLTAAANAYNTYCLTGPVTFSLTDALYSTAETFPIVFVNNLDASATNSLLIIPAAGLAVSITPTNVTLGSVFKFQDARYITVDGINTAGASISVNNANISSASANIWLASAGQGNKFIAIINTSLKGGYNGGSNGVIAGVDGPVPSGTGGSDNDNITISGNSFSTFFQGILAVGSATVSAGGLDNWVISNNLIGPAASGTANVAGNGIYVNGAVNMAITSNTIQNLSTSAAGGGIALINDATFSVTANVIKNFTTSASGFYGINMNANNIGFSVAQNTITDLYSTTSSSGVNALAGLYIGASVINGTVNANVIRTIVNTNTGGYGIRGMIVNTGVLASNINIRNNFLSDIYSYPDYVSFGSFQWAPVGIHLEGATTGGINIDFNSINLFGAHPGYAASGGTPSSPLYINAAGGNLNVRNNIFSNTYDNLALTTDVVYAIYANVSATVFTSVDYNDYFVGGPSTSQVLGYLGANQTNLLGIQTAFGGNLNSKNILPVFVSNTDLHMQLVGGNAGLDNQGTPLVGITADIENTTRSATTPDMGAHEYTIPVCTTANGGVLAVTAATACAGQTLVAVSTGFSIGLTTTYLWKVGVTPGGPYAPVSGGTGSTTTSYTSAPLPAGVYYITLETICAAASLTATSNEGTLTVNALPTATATSSTPVICSGQNLSLAGSSDIGTSYLWNGPGSYTSGTQNPSIVSASATASGSYSLTTSANGCASTMAIVAVTVNATPSAITLTPASAIVCPGIAQPIIASGGTIPKTLNFGTQANLNGAATTATGYPAPYSAFYGGQRMQMLVLATELTAGGFSAGSPLSSIQFPVVSLGSNWGGSINSNQSFQVSIGATALTSLATFQTGLTNVVAPANFAPTVGYANIHNFASAFVWNGTSNIILETTFSNNFFGGANDVVIQYNSPTAFPSTVVYRADSQTPGVVAANTAVSFAYSVRPDFKLNGQGFGSYSWLPVTGLSSAVGNTVSATLSSPAIYTVTSANGTCTRSTSISLSVTPTPTINIATTSTAVCVGNTATLTANGANSYSWSATVTTNTNAVNPTATTVYTVMGQNLNCTAVSQTVEIVANTLPVVSAVSNPTVVCAGQSATLTAGGASTYVWTSGPSTNSFVVSPTSNTTYSVTGTSIAGCTGQTTVAIATGTVPVLTITPASATVCAKSAATFTASGATTYSWNTGTQNAAVTIIPASSGTYIVTGTNSAGCSASQTVSLTANALPIVLVSPASPTVCSNESLVLTASGATTYSWMPGTVNTNTIMFGPSATSTTYVVEGEGTNTCKNSMTVTVIVDACTGLREQNVLNGNVSLYPNPSTGLITASFGFEGSKDILVLNSVGALIMKASTEEASTTFDLSGHAKGVYFVRVTTNGASANYKIVIQ